LIFRAFCVVTYTKKQTKTFVYQFLLLPTFNFLLHAADSHAPSLNLDPLTDCQHCTNPIINITKSAVRLMHTPLSCHEVLSANFAT